MHAQVRIRLHANRAILLHACRKVLLPKLRRVPKAVERTLQLPKHIPFRIILPRRDDINVTFNSCAQESRRSITRSDVPTERRGKRQQELQSAQGRCGGKKFVAVVHVLGVPTDDYAATHSAVALPHLDPTGRNGFVKCFLRETRRGNLVENGQEAMEEDFPPPAG